MAEGIAESLALPLVIPRYEGVIGSYLGETASRVSKLIDFARGRACVLFFDEFDTLSKERGDRHETGEIKRVVSSLLLQFDQLPSYVVLIAATNHAELLDRAAWRRFQVRLELPPPSQVLRVAWLTRFAEQHNLDWGISVAKLADQLSVENFAELEEFSLDMLRRRVLGQPDGNLREVVQTRIQQWKLRRGAQKRPRE